MAEIIKVIRNWFLNIISIIFIYSKNININLWAIYVVFILPSFLLTICFWFSIIFKSSANNSWILTIEEEIEYNQKTKQAIPITDNFAKHRLRGMQISDMSSRPISSKKIPRNLWQINMKW